jgi:hypothetical protein
MLHRDAFHPATALGLALGALLVSLAVAGVALLWLALGAILIAGLMFYMRRNS